MEVKRDRSAERGVTVDAAGEFSVLYRREVDGQVRLAALLVGSADVAHDVVHDAFVGLYRRWDGVANRGAYLQRSVLNGCRDVGRRRLAQQRLLNRLFDRDEQSGPADLLGDLLAALPFNQRAAVVLRFYGGLSAAEIAEQMGCPQGSIGPWIERALTTMRKALR